MTKLTEQMIREAHANGLTVAQTATHLSVSPMTVYNWANKCGLKFKVGKRGPKPRQKGEKIEAPRQSKAKPELLPTSLIDRALATDAITQDDIMKVRDKAIWRLSTRGWKPEAIAVQLRVPLVDVHRAIAAGRE